MRLSAELFAELTLSLDSGSVAAPSGPQHERRRAPRVEVRASVPLELIAADVAPGAKAQIVTVIGDVRDISPRGIKVLLPNELPGGCQFVLRLKRADGTTIGMLCTSMHCKRISPTLCSVGAEFTCVLRDLPVNTSNDQRNVDAIRHSMLD